jgi:uncharacterized protein (TIGR00725 family)
VADLTGINVAVVGPGSSASPDEVATAESVAETLARDGAVIVTGGLDGVMRAAARGARRGGGVSVGLLPGTDRSGGSPAHTVLLPTGLGELRNGLVVRAADVVVAIGGGWGTLSEVALAVRIGVPVVAVSGWHLPAPGALEARDADDALRLVRSVAGS